MSSSYAHLFLVYTFFFVYVLALMSKPQGAGVFLLYKYFVFQQTLKIVQEKIMISYNRANFCYFYNCYTFTFPRITQSLAFAER